jgi:hypothetical protein
LNARFLDLSTAQQNLINDLRKARLMATRQGVHYRVVFADGAYRIERMRESTGSEGLWLVDALAEPQRIELPSQVSVGVAGGGSTAVEFDSRGMVVPPEDAGGEVFTVTLSEGESATARVEIWPSGQIQKSAATATVAS